MFAVPKQFWINHRGNKAEYWTNWMPTEGTTNVQRKSEQKKKKAGNCVVSFEVNHSGVVFKAIEKGKKLRHRRRQQRELNWMDLAWFLIKVYIINVQRNEYLLGGGIWRCLMNDILVKENTSAYVVIPHFKNSRNMHFSSFFLHTVGASVFFLWE